MLDIHLSLTFNYLNKDISSSLMIYETLLTVFILLSSVTLFSSFGNIVYLWTEIYNFSNPIQIYKTYNKNKCKFEKTKNRREQAQDQTQEQVEDFVAEEKEHKEIELF